MAFTAVTGMLSISYFFEHEDDDTCPALNAVLIWSFVTFWENVTSGYFPVII